MERVCDKGGEMKIIFILLIIGLLIVSGCEKAIKQNPIDEQTEQIEINTTDPQSEYYDGLDEALDELDAVE